MTALAAAARQRSTGLLLATLGSIAFSGKAIVAKLLYLQGLDAVTVVNDSTPEQGVARLLAALQPESA